MIAWSNKTYKYEPSETSLAFSKASAAFLKGEKDLSFNILLNLERSAMEF
jgi:hypothetical protein